MDSAQGFNPGYRFNKKPYREAVIHHSPGLQPWVLAPKTRPESGVRGVGLAPAY